MSQIEELANAVDIAIQEVSMRYERPELNAILGALATHAAIGLALIADQAVRERVFDNFCAEIKRCMDDPSTAQMFIAPFVDTEQRQEGKPN